MSEQTIETVIIQGAPFNPYVKIVAKYDYSKGTTCPNCNHEAGGFPWGGWFSCEMCNCLALVEGGDAYIPEKKL